MIEYPALVRGVGRHLAHPMALRPTTASFCRAITAITLVISGALFGCTSVQVGPASSLTARGALLEVTNNTWDDMTVYLVQGNGEVPLGNVASLSKRTILITPANIATSRESQLTSRRRGMSDGFASLPFSFATGDVLRWTIDRNHAPNVDVRAVVR